MRKKSKSVFIPLILLVSLLISVFGCEKKKNPVSGGEDRSSQDWEAVVGTEGNDYANSVAVTEDGGYIVTGSTESFAPIASEVYLIRTNRLGDTLWTRSYTAGQASFGYSVVVTPGGGFVVAGVSDDNPGFAGDVLAVKVDTLGDTLWTKTYGGGGYDTGRQVRVTADGGQKSACQNGCGA